MFLVWPLSCQVVSEEKFVVDFAIQHQEAFELFWLYFWGPPILLHIYMQLRSFCRDEGPCG